MLDRAVDHDCSGECSYSGSDYESLLSFIEAMARGHGIPLHFKEVFESLGDEKYGHTVWFTVEKKAIPQVAKA